MPESSSDGKTGCERGHKLLLLASLNFFAILQDHPNKVFKLISCPWVPFYLSIFFLMNGKTPFLESASLRERKRKAMTRIKQIYKISKKGNAKISCHLVPN